METVIVVQAAAKDDNFALEFGLPVGLTLFHILGGCIFLGIIAKCIKANRDFKAWLDARYDVRSLRYLFLYFLGAFFWEFYCLGLIAYTAYAKVALALRRHREKKQQRNANIDLEEARPKDDDGSQSIISEPKPSYQSRLA